MLTSKEKLQNFQIQYPLERLAPLEEILFLDIETTGFTAKGSYLYLIGCAYYEDECFYIRQWMAESYEQEKDILEAFFSFAGYYKYIIHFNGNNFDLPFLCQKCEQWNLPYSFEGFDGLDIYKRIAPYKFFLKLPNCKQKTLENYLGIHRTDTFNGGELIGIYHDYVKMPSAFARDSLLLHNCDDIRGMLSILPILAYYDIFNGIVKAKKVQANHYKDYNGNSRQELIMTLTLPTPLPKPISVGAGGCYFKGEGGTGSLKIPIYEEELKYFYANYKDYYYLPTEDVALHKSVASFVDKEHRMPASAATCYTRKTAAYLPQWEVMIEPFFKREYKSKELFFELTDSLKKNRSAFTAYAGHVLDMISTNY